MEIKDLKKLLQEPYSTENWRVLLKDVFQNVDFLQTPTVIPTGDSRVKELRQYGTVRLSDGKNLALFELKLNDKVNLIGNRVGLNELVKKHIDQYRHHGILSIFEQGKEDYRFTFTAKNTEFDEEEGFIDKFTDTKRFTYILGANESCRTPAERFYTLSKIQEKTIEQVEDAFNVEKLSKKFFKEYIAQFDHLVHYLLNKPTYFQGVFNGKESDARNYVKRFMGRLVFLKFIQKKGWLGVPVTESGWENGNFQFLEDQFKQFKNKEVFVSQFLNPLFYEALDVGNRTNDEFQNRGYKIPYLSGGLFDNDYKNDNRVDFPEESLTSLFDFFEMYNFTIDENDLHDKEVGIDPEMLGHIFENLLEDNKDKGAFYTPKEIVRYMCQESLKEYLKTHLEKQNLWPENPPKITEITESIANFVERKETSAILKFDKEFATALKDVKICDPAIGSGAFPMGLLNEIFTMMKNLHEVSPDIVGKIWGMEKNKWQPNIIKENIIRNSIYGVDIEAGAVDIARLRFWLSLVLEEQEPKPLPHLDYKIVVGNSLVSKLGDTIIDIDWEADVKTQELFASSFIENQKNILNKITDKQIKAFDPNSDDEKLSYEIKNLKIDLLINQLQLLVENKGTQTIPSPTDRKFKELNALWLDTQGWKKQIKELEKLKQNKTADLEFFDWRLDFAEVMNPRINENLGFDIVIGNPPYIQMSKDGSYLSNLYKNQKYRTFEKTGDLYSLFYEKGIDLLKFKGNICYITSNKWMKAGYGKSLRKLFSEFDTLKLLDLGSGIFETATVDTNIIVLKKNKNANNTKAIKFIDNTQFNNLIGNKNNWVNIKYLDDDIWNILSIQDVIIKEKADEIGLVLSKWNIKINYGIKTGFNNAYIITTEQRNAFILKNKRNESIIKPLLRGKDIKRYFVNKNDLWLLFIPWHFPLHNDKSVSGNSKIAESAFMKNYPDVYNHLTEYKTELSSRNKSETGIRYEWYALQRCANTYIEDFDKEKLIYSEISQSPCFSFDTNKTYVGNTAYILTGEKLKYLNGLLNSKMVTYIFSKFYSINLGNNGYRYLAQYMENLPIPKVGDLKAKKIELLVNEIIKLKNLHLNADVLNLEQQIDNLVYKLYNLTFEEALIVEPELEERLSKEEYDAIEI